MARPLKPQKLTKSVRHPKSGRVVECFLNRDTQRFFADVNGVEIEADSFQELEGKVWHECDRQTMFTWKKIVVVNSTVPTYHTNSHTVGLEYKVHEVSPQQAGARRMMERKFYSGREDLSTYLGPTESAPLNGVYVLPYTEDLAGALDTIQAGLVVLRERIQRLLGNGDAERLLVGMADSMRPLMLKEGDDVEAG